MASRELELPIVQEDLPNNRLSNIDTEKQSVPVTPMKAATDFLLELESLLKQKNVDQNELYSLYDYKFNKIGQQYFLHNTWPAPEEIEASLGDQDINTTAQYLYSELCYRHYFSRLYKSHKSVEEVNVMTNSWDNYIELFSTIQREEVPLPSAWIFDIIDEFIYQFTIVNKWMKQYSKGSIPHEVQDFQQSNQYWQVDQVERTLNEIIAKSDIVQSKDSVKRLTTHKKKIYLSYFGYFSLVGLLRVYVLKGQFEDAIKLIEPIDFDSLTEYSKAVASYLTLFYYAGYSYLMTRRYREAMKIFEIIILFFYKYKSLFTKSFQFDNMERQAEKCLFLLAIAVVFQPTQLNDTIAQKFKDVALRKNKPQQQQQMLQQQNDKVWDYYQRLLKFDTTAFSDLFNQGTNKIQLNEPSNQGLPKLLKEFEEAKQVLEIIPVIKLYQKVSIQKVAKFLKASEAQIQTQIKNFAQSSKSNLKENVLFEETILKKFMIDPVLVEIKFENGELEVDEFQTKKEYRVIYEKNFEKCRDLMGLHEKIRRAPLKN